MKLSKVLLAVLTALVITGCAGGKFDESGKSDKFSHSYVGLEEDALTKRKKAVFLLVNESEMNVASINGTYQVLDKDGKVIQKSSFNKDDYPYLLGAGEKKKMTVISGTLPSNAASMRIKVSKVRYK
jgi:hypothetical protein